VAAELAKAAQELAKVAAELPKGAEELPNSLEELASFWLQKGVLSTKYYQDEFFLLKKWWFSSFFVLTACWLSCNSLDFSIIIHTFNAAKPKSRET